MQIRAAILWEQGAPLSVEPAELDPPGPGEVLIEVKAAGVCHSDLHATAGDWPMGVPLVPGHEGAGVVHQRGSPAYRASCVGDHVVLCWAPACRACPPAWPGLRCCAIASTRRRFATSCRLATRGSMREGRRWRRFSAPRVLRPTPSCRKRRLVAVSAESSIRRAGCGGLRGGDRRRRGEQCGQSPCWRSRRRHWRGRRGRQRGSRRRAGRRRANHRRRSRSRSVRGRANARRYRGRAADRQNR